MKSTIAPIESTENEADKRLVKLSVTVDVDEFERDIDAAFRKIAREVKLPGFRNGKAPRKVLEARIGLEAARSQAIQDSIPVYLAQAVADNDVDLIATPEVEITGGEESGEVAFDATCEIRPEITVPGYGGLRVELPSPNATDDDVEREIEAERRRHASLVAAERPSEVGDMLTISFSATRDGEPVAGLTDVEDWNYELGKGWIAENFDEHLTGVSDGDELTFTAELSGGSGPADFEVTVEAVQKLVLPELTDEWVADHLGEFDTVEAWTESLRERIGAAKLSQTRSRYVEELFTALSQLVDQEPPASMVDADLQARVQDIVGRFQQQGLDLQAWLEATGQSADSFVADLRGQSERAAKVDLALRAVARAEGLEATDDDVEVEYERIAMRVRQKVADVRRTYERNHAVSELRAQIAKNQALDWLMHRAELVDPDGAPIDRELVLDHDHDGHDHDGHDHDHDGHDPITITTTTTTTTGDRSDDEC